MNTGLNVNDIVSVSVALAPTAAQTRSFGTLLILGDSAVVDTQARLRLYTSIGAVAGDFGSSAPEYLAAKDFFAQSPQPTQCYIGRWAGAATSGVLQGATLSVAQQAIGNFTTVASGGIDFTIDGTAHNLTTINLSAVTTLNGVAAAITTALAGAGTCVWNATQGNFSVTSATTGTASSVAFATVGAGTDISALLGLQSTQGGYSVAGIAAESLLSAVTTIDQMTNAWYGLQVAATTAITDAVYVGVAGYIEAATNSHVFGVTTQEAGALSAASTTDLAYLMQQGKFNRSFVQYSSSDPFASASIFGRAFTVDFNGNNTAITLKFKQEPGIKPEYLTETQAAVLNSKNCNVYVEYNNATAILQQGTMASGQFFDVIHGTDWLQNAIQTAVYNLLYLSTTKIPQTDPGVNQIVATVAQECQQAADNGLVAPGVWTGPAVGALSSGQTLPRGYYVYAPPISTQSQADRGARKSPVIQAAIKLAGAIHSVSLIVNVNQ